MTLSVEQSVRSRLWSPEFHQRSSCNLRKRILLSSVPVTRFRIVIAKADRRHVFYTEITDVDRQSAGKIKLSFTFLKKCFYSRTGKKGRSYRISNSNLQSHLLKIPKDTTCEKSWNTKLSPWTLFFQNLNKP